MIAHVRGLLVEKTFDRVVVECGGVGYALVVTLNTLAELPEVGREVTLRTYLQVREDAHVLYGFSGDEERRAFELCISVSGIGPKLAIALLSSLRPEALADAVRREDAARLAKAPGIGKRTAERLIVELKDRLDKLGLGPTASRPAAAGATAGSRLQGSAAQVASALTNLGYRPDAAERAAEEAAAEQPAAPLQDLLRRALGLLAG